MDRRQVLRRRYREVGPIVFWEEMVASAPSSEAREIYEGMLLQARDLNNTEPTGVEADILEAAEVINFVEIDPTRSERLIWWLSGIFSKEKREKVFSQVKDRSGRALRFSGRLLSAPSRFTSKNPRPVLILAAAPVILSLRYFGIFGIIFWGAGVVFLLSKSIKVLEGTRHMISKRVSSVGIFSFLLVWFAGGLFFNFIVTPTSTSEPSFICVARNNIILRCNNEIFGQPFSLLHITPFKDRVVKITIPRNTDQFFADSMAVGRLRFYRRVIDETSIPLLDPSFRDILTTKIVFRVDIRTPLILPDGELEDELIGFITDMSGALQGVAPDSLALGMTVPISSYERAMESVISPFFRTASVDIHQSKKTEALIDGEWHSVNKPLSIP